MKYNNACIGIMSFSLPDCEDETEISVYELACSRVAGDAIRKGSSDNVTVMLVEIKNKSQQPK